MTPKPTSPAVAPSRRRFAVRCFVILIVSALFIDTLPQRLLSGGAVRTHVVWALQTCGLEIGPWSMFAPEPKVNNLWLTASIRREGRNEQVWTSPAWQDVGSVEKFYRFRYMNYYKALTNPMNIGGPDDFADYLRRTLPQTTDESQLVLTANGLRFMPPVEGGIPKPDEATWMLYNQPIATTEPRR